MSLNRNAIEKTVFASAFILSLTTVILQPFGLIPGFYFRETVGTLHNLALFCVVCLLWFFWSLEKMPFPARFFFTLVYVWIGYNNYDSAWKCFAESYSPFGWSIFDVFIRYAGTHGIPLLIVYVFQKFKRNWEFPSLNFERFFLVLFVNSLLLYWLNSTGFFYGYHYYRMGLSSEDPHGPIWFIGKLVGTLSWIIVPENTVVTKKIKKLYDKVMGRKTVVIEVPEEWIKKNGFSEFLFGVNNLT